MPEVSGDSISLLLVKPDGVNDPDKASYIASSLEASPLNLVRRQQITLSATDVDDLWPKFASPEHAFTRRMLALYMTSGPSEVLVLTGPDVMTECRAVRSRVRRRCGDAAFENALHTPTDANELASNLAFLTGDGGPFVRHIDESAGAGRFGRLAQLTEVDVTALADELWAQRMHGGWSALRQPGTADHAGSVRLHPGSDNSVDYEVSAIADVFTDRPLAWCATRLLEAEKFGSSELPIDGDPVATAERLSQFGVKVSTAAELSQTQDHEDTR